MSNSTKIDTEEELNSSSHHQSNEIPITRSTISDGVQSNIAATKSGSLNETIRLFTSDPDFELADILERSTINEQDPTFHSSNSLSFYYSRFLIHFLFIRHSIYFQFSIT